MMAKKRGPTLNQEKETFKEMGVVLEKHRKDMDCSKALLDKLEWFRKGWSDELSTKWLNSK